MINIKTPFIIYSRAVGLYALLTVPALAIPEMYVTSLIYVLTYGWFAWFVFTVLYSITVNLVDDFVMRILSLFGSVVAAVAFAYNMMGVFGTEADVWHSGFIIFPFAAVIVGWISICFSCSKIRSAGYVPEE